MIEFGETLRKAREAKGLSTGDVAKATHIMVQIVESLEKEDFSRIVAPIYGRGFVKLYCEAVGIDAKPMIAEFMEIYNGNRPAVIRMAEPEPPSRETDAVKPSVPPVQPPAFPAEADSSPQADFALEQESGPIRMASAFPDYRADVPDEKNSGFSIPPSFWRILVLVVAAGVVLWLLFAGFKALYKITMSPPADGVKTVEKALEKASPQKDGQLPPRKEMDIPPLYID